MPVPVEVRQIWRRRVKQHDLWERAEVIGRFAQAELDEWVLRPLDVLAPAVSVTAADLEASFDLETAAPAKPPQDIADTGGAWIDG